MKIRIARLMCRTLLSAYTVLSTDTAHEDKPGKPYVGKRTVWPADVTDASVQLSARGDLLPRPSKYQLHSNKRQFVYQHSCLNEI